jgi:Zn-dependent peptidase ImmA (M78 family)
VHRSDYYEQLKELARQTRVRFGFDSPRVLRSDLRRIYRVEGIRIDLWPYRLKRLRGAYFNDESGPTVMLAKGLPEDPMVFTMGHELKHHLADRGSSLSYCDSSNQSNPIEIGAEIFAAELIYPDDDFRSDLNNMGVEQHKCTAELLVRLKHETRTTLSYAGLAKRAEFMGFAETGSLAGVKWRKLEEEIYGTPIYKLLLQRRRQRAR